MAESDQGSVVKYRRKGYLAEFQATGAILFRLPASDPLGPWPEPL